LFVATGNIKEKFEQWRNIPVDKIINNDTLKTITLLDDFYIIAQFILADEFWSAHIEQIYLNQYGDMELVPKVGNHKIIFGTSEQMEEKFWKLKTFYKQGLNYTGWENYDTLNLKFQNQVVCTKKLKEQDSKEEITAR
jgi:cell division protein FtsQ